MKIEYNGTGKNRHALIWTDEGEWIATFKAGREAEIIEALAPGANGSQTISTNEQEE